MFLRPSLISYKASEAEQADLVHGFHLRRFLTNPITSCICTLMGIRGRSLWIIIEKAVVFSISDKAFLLFKVTSEACEKLAPILLDMVEIHSTELYINNRVDA